MNNGELSIGTATERINLLAGEGIWLSEWVPAATGHEGAFGESEQADGRALESYRNQTAIETIVLHLSSEDQNTTIRLEQDLRRMIRKALNYAATNWQGEAVYLAARGRCETNTRYALVIDGSMPQDAAPHRSPFQGPRATAAGLTLVVEHMPWTENPPGAGTCVQVSGTGASYTRHVTVTARPLQSADDGTYVSSTGGWLGGGLTLFFGSANPGEYLTGIRFPALNVPQGATIVSAYITLVGDGAEGAGTCNLEIVGEDADNAAIYASASDLKSRPWTAATVAWNSIAAWALGTSYNTPNLSPIVQEIVDRPAWAALNAMGFMVAEHGSAAGAFRTAASYDNLVRTEPILTVVYAEQVPYGRSATCDDEVFLANKQNTANITHVYRDNHGVWENVGLGAWPYGLFPAAPVQTNDAIYFGIETGTGSGPFCSLVFDVGTAATWAGNTPHAHWEYWNGAAWTEMTSAANYLVDNTATVFNQPFRRTGVHSVHWSPPSNWATTNPGMGVTGWWIRCRVQLGVGDTVTVPTQQKRDVYTVTWASVAIDGDQVPGDMPALMRMFLHCPSGTDGFDAPLGSDKVIVGLRGIERGEDFSAFINLSDEQNPARLWTQYGMSGAVTRVADPRAVTGNWLSLNAASLVAGTWTDVVGIDFPDEDLGGYSGTFHAFLRAMLVTGAGGVAGDAGFRLRHSSWPYMPTGMVYSADYYNQHVNINELFDLGPVTLPAYPRTGSTPLEYYSITIQARVVDTDFTVRLHDLILIPTDEWAAAIESFKELDNVPSPPGAWLATLGRFYLDVDGLDNPKQAGAYFTWETWQTRVCAWIYSPNGQPVLQPGRDQRLWVVAAKPHFDGLTLYRASSPYMAHSVQLFRNARYESMRGDR